MFVALHHVREELQMQSTGSDISGFKLLLR